jgi:formylmethanofuran dehydrogenase subunit E
MYLCLDCNNIFEEPHYYEETHGLDSLPYEILSECPHCGGSFVETICCDLCGEWVAGEYVKLSNGTVACEQCYEVNDIGD